MRVLVWGPAAPSSEHFLYGCMSCFYTPRAFQSGLTWNPSCSRERQNLWRTKAVQVTMEIVSKQRSPILLYLLPWEGFLCGRMTGCTCPTAQGMLCVCYVLGPTDFWRPWYLHNINVFFLMSVGGNWCPQCSFHMDTPLLHLINANIIREEVPDCSPVWKEPQEVLLLRTGRPQI